MKLALLLAVSIAPAFSAGLDAAQQSTVTKLEGKLLAPCCYQEPVGRHQSEAALRMRLEIARLVQEGKTESDVMDYYVARYGSKIVADFAPTPEWARYLPWLLTLAGAAAVSIWIRRMVRAHSAKAA